MDMENHSKLLQNKLLDYEKSLKGFEADFEDLNKDFSYYSECDTAELDEKEIKAAVKSCEALYEKMSAIKKQAQSVKSEVEAADVSSRELLIKMRAAKEDYESLRTEHQKEIEKGKDKDDEYKQSVLQAAAGIDALFMREYERIKGIKPNPVALFINHTCKGCNMGLPSGLESAIIAATKPVCCENCGRMLYVPGD